jgi:hypothetical protein
MRIPSAHIYLDYSILRRNDLNASKAREELPQRYCTYLKIKPPQTTPLVLSISRLVSIALRLSGTSHSMGPRQSGRKELQFVTVSDPTNKDVAQRKLVRKHVMRRYWKGIKDGVKEPTPGKERVELASVLPSDDRPLKPGITSPVCMSHGHRYGASRALPTQCLNCGEVVSSDSEGSSLSSQDSSPAPDELSSLVVGSPYVVLGGGDRDPFQTFPVPAAPYTEFLIRHCKYPPCL